MKKVKYLFQRIVSMDYKEMFKTINRINKKTKKNKIILFFDMIGCGIKHQAGYVDYEFYNMYDLTKEQRKTIMTRGRNNHYVAELNPKKYWHIFDNKNEFNEKFSKYMNREWMYINEENFDVFNSFIKRHKVVIVKPQNLSCGKGVRKIDTTEYDAKELYKELINEKTFLVEEVASQHEKMNELHPDSVNTVRVVTIIGDDGVPRIITGVVRIGTNHKVVDNFNNDGVCAMIDLSTGKINTTAINSKGETFEKHPTTNVKLKGFQIPLWKELNEMVCEAALVVPEIRLVGWDICVGKNGPLIIEANQFPAHDLYQPLFGVVEKEGIVPTFEKAIHVKTIEK